MEQWRVFPVRVSLRGEAGMGEHKRQHPSLWKGPSGRGAPSPLQFSELKLRPTAATTPLAPSGSPCSPSPLGRRSFLSSGTNVHKVLLFAVLSLCLQALACGAVQGQEALGGVLRGGEGAVVRAAAAGGDGLGGSHRCQSTLQGRVLASDDLGYTCRRWDVNVRTGCCDSPDSAGAPPVHLRASSKALLVFPRTQALLQSASSETGPAASAATRMPWKEGGRFSCATCDVAEKCCSVYEYCVSCCLDPAHTAARLALTTPRAQQPSARPFASVFEFCTTRCRHNSRSVVHENAYISERHHCFSLPLSAHPPLPAPEHLGREVKVAVAPLGTSCDDECAKINMRCDEAYLPLLNNCTIMKQHMPCRSGCISSAGPDQPAEVADTAPQRQQPGACVLNASPALFSCGGYHENTRRICPCRSGMN